MIKPAPESIFSRSRRTSRSKSNALGSAPTPAKILVGFVVLGVLLGGIGIYEPLVEFAGAGASVPLLGFGNTLAKGVREAVAESGFLGVLTGGLKSTAGGITAAIIAGLLVSLIFKQKDKS